MPTTPPQSAESDGARPPCRTAAVTEVPSANSGHCSAIPDTMTTLWEPATPSPDVLGTIITTVPPTPHTSLVLSPLGNPRTAWAQPSNAARALTGARLPPAGPSRHHHVAHRGRNPLQEPQRRRWSCQDARAISARPGRRPGQPHARRHDLQYPIVYFLQWTFAVRPRFGEKRRLLPPSVHVPRPSLCL